MSEVNSRKKVSLISIIVLFLVIILITIFIFKGTGIDNSTSELSLKNTENNEYLASKKAEITSYITSLNEIYGIKVLYGDDTINYAKKVDATTLSDLDIVNNNLKVLFHTLEKYSPDMFKSFKNGEYKMEIILLDNFNNNNIALASKNNLNEVKLYVSNDEKLERAIHHELFHIFEYYMTDKDKTIFRNWSSFNPENFVYNSDISKLNSEYVNLNKEDNLNNNKDYYFVTKYAKTNEKEDRAETFAEIMMIIKKQEYTDMSEHIKNKSNYILEKMNKFFNVKSLYFSKIVN